MPQYKERGSNLDKCLSPYLGIINRKPIKYSMKYSHQFLKCGSKCKTAFDLMAFCHDFQLWLCFRARSRKARHACRMNKKGQILVYLGQIKDWNPLNSTKISSFWNVKMPIKILKKALHAITTHNKSLK